MKMHLLFVLLLCLLCGLCIFAFRKRLYCLSRNIFMAELIDKHCGTFYNLGTVYSLKSVLMSQPHFSNILKNIFFKHKSNPTDVYGYLLYAELGICCKTIHNGAWCRTGECFKLLYFYNIIYGVIK